MTPRSMALIPGLCWVALAMWAPVAAMQHPHGGDDKSPAVLIPNLGRLHHPITTTSEQAQAFFDQGLTLMFGFNHEEAVRSFQRAAELDPASPMPLWGAACALGPNINMPRDAARDREAHALVQKAIGLAAAAPPHEAAYVEALARRYSADPPDDLRTLDLAYRDAMQDLTRRFPDDLDAATLYAESLMDLNPWKFWSHDGKPAEGTEEIVAVLESVLRRRPDHPGANHYYIHAVEASPRPERALASARRLEDLVPGAGHLVHMPGHIYLRTGDFQDAVRSNVKAVESDRALFQAAGRRGMYPLMYYTHNLHFVAYGHMMEGRSADALRWAEEASRNATTYMTPGPLPADIMPMLELFVPQPLFAHWRFSRWDNILGLKAPDPRLPIHAALWRAARVLAHVAKRDLVGAEREKVAFAAARDKVPPASTFDFSAGPDIVNVAWFIVDGRILEARGDREAALASLRSAVQAQDALPYTEPPDWFYPARETLGGSLLRFGNAAEAERVFRQDLERNPRNARSLFGLWRSLEAQKRAVDAAWVKREYDTAWKNADVTLRVEDL